MFPPQKPRKTRHDKGSVKATDRDIRILPWIARKTVAEEECVFALAQTDQRTSRDVAV